MHGFKSAILAKMKNCQNGTFEPVHEIQDGWIISWKNGHNLETETSN